MTSPLNTSSTPLNVSSTPLNTSSTKSQIYIFVNDELEKLLNDNSLDDILDDNSLNGTKPNTCYENIKNTAFFEQHNITPPSNQSEFKKWIHEKYANNTLYVTGSREFCLQSAKFDDESLPFFFDNTINSKDESFAEFTKLASMRIYKKHHMCVESVQTTSSAFNWILGSEGTNFDPLTYEIYTCETDINSNKYKICALSIVFTKCYFFDVQYNGYRIVIKK